MADMPRKPRVKYDTVPVEGGIKATMPSHTEGNVLVFQSGGVTAVINQSLAGVVQEALRQQAFGKIYGAVHGLEGMLKQEFVDLGGQPRGVWRDVARTPAAALGSGRRRLRPEDLPQVMQTLERLGITYLFTIGGNDSAETAHLIAQEAQATHRELRVMVVPKTVDNDLPVTDHCPGYGSSARFVALATMGAGRDAEAMGQASPITLLEVMGRNAGWLAAAAALGKREERDAPHLVCIPERQLDEEDFLDRVEEAYRRWGFAVAVVNENVRGPEGPLGHRGDPLYVDDFGHPYFQSPAQYLAGQVSRRLKVRARFEKPGTIQRSLVTCTSKVDAQEAFLVGQMAVRYALGGHTDLMVTLVREPGKQYRCSTGLVPLEAVAGQERLLPEAYLDSASSLPTPEFLKYARPLAGGALPRFGRLR
jgi:6-phosphofructokinase 1